MVNSGATIIDIGGESTRPGSITIDEKKEWKRVVDTITKFKNNFPLDCPFNEYMPLDEFIYFFVSLIAFFPIGTNLSLFPFPITLITSSLIKTLLKMNKVFKK